jgi:5-formyltetrahydrofolate cyclo-ligase
MTKQNWRGELKARLDEFKPTPSQHQAVRTQLASYLSRQKGIWGAFKSIGHEVNLDQLVEDCKHLNWVFPVVAGEDLEFYSPGPQGFEKGPWGIEQPVTSQARKVSVPDLSGVLVPGLGFDRKGNRLGRGKAYYDRTLRGFQGTSVGVAWSCQVVEELPCEPHDQRVDSLVSDREMIYFTR